MADQVSEEIAWSTECSLLTLEQLSDSAELHPALVEKFVQHGLIEPADDQASTCYSPSPVLNVSAGSSPEA